MSHEGHTRFLEDRLELVQESLRQIPGLDGMRDDLKDDLLEHVMSYVEGYEDAGQDYPILQLVIEWLVHKTAETMSSEDLDAMAREWGIEQEKQDVKNMPPHFRYLVE